MSNLNDDAAANAVKAWWNKYGNALLVGIVLAIAVMYGMRYWTDYRDQVASDASSLYDEYQQGLMARQEETLTASYEKLRSDYPKTPYATAVTLLEAARAVSQNNFEQAKTQLNWVLKEGHDYAKPLARIRLAEINVHEGHFDEALSMLQSGEPGAYKPAFDELQGDILVLKGDVNKALELYKDALVEYQAQGFDNILLQYKLQTYAPVMEQDSEAGA